MLLRAAPRRASPAGQRVAAAARRRAAAVAGREGAAGVAAAPRHAEPAATTAALTVPAQPCPRLAALGALALAASALAASPALAAEGACALTCHSPRQADVLLTPSPSLARSGRGHRHSRRLPGLPGGLRRGAQPEQSSPRRSLSPLQTPHTPRLPPPSSPQASLLIFFSEIGDKTFFIAVLLALQQPRGLARGFFAALSHACCMPPGHSRCHLHPSHHVT